MSDETMGDERPDNCDAGVSSAGGVVPTSSAKADRKAPGLKLHGGEGTLRIEVDGDFTRLLEATGRNAAVSAGIIMQIAVLGSRGQRFDDEASNFALGFIDAMKPQDTVETSLLTQMAATHQAVMMFARRLNHVDGIPQQDSAERAFNKLLRSYAAQVEALKRYRSKGQQVVRVERVTVESGGQAIVGNVSQGAGGTKK
jgi:hypothetical protein